MYIRVVGKDLEYFNGKDIILFGCGSCGVKALKEFENIGANILCFIDNNKNSMGAKVEGYEVMQPDILYNYPEANVIISSTYEDEIEEQLRKMKINNFYRVKVGVLKEKIPKEMFFNKVLSYEDTNQYIYDGLIGPSPFFVGRLGSVELECLSHYLYFLDRKTEKDKVYPENVKRMMNINAGFFPTTERLLDDFCSLYLEGLNEMDLIWSMWFSKYEDMIYKDYCIGKAIADYDDTVFPFNKINPWTAALKDKKVLVIHPFETSIINNYKVIDKLFDNKNFIPKFELVTLKAVQSIANSKTQYDNWFLALEDMQCQINDIDFDIALIGAGAYGLALGAYVKSIGKKAIHIGGMLQLFFGIRGKAWDKLNIYNEYWTSPLIDETPHGYKCVEAGRYW